MKAEDIRKCIKKLNIGPEADLSALKKELTEELSADTEGMAETIEALGELSVEYGERLSQVTDENRAAELERCQSLLENTEAELKELAKKQPAKPSSVLIADSSEERLEDPMLNRPIAVNEAELKKQEQPAEKKEPEKSKKPEEKTGLFGRKKDTNEDKEKKLEKKADELIKKKKQEQEAERKRQADAQKAQNAQNGQDAQDQKDSDDGKSTGDKGNDLKNGTQPGGNAPSAQSGKSSTVGGMDSRLAAALKLYYDRHYAKAREELKTLANVKDMSREDLGTAKFFYGKMFDKGEGGPQDDEAARFWMEEAAKLKNVDALMWVGGKLAETTPASAAESVELTARALKCFQKANKAALPKGNDVAKQKYIEVCVNMPIYRNAKKQALAYCDELADQKNDAYEKKQYEDKKEAIKENYKNNNAAKFSGGGVIIKNARDVFVIIGALMTILADYGIFMTLQNKGDSLPKAFSLSGAGANAFSFVLVPLAQFVSNIVESIAGSIAESYVNFVLPGSLLYALMLFTLGRMFIGLEFYNSRGKIAEAACEIAAIATLFTIFGNMATYVFPGGSLVYFGGAFAIAIIMIVVVTAASIVTIPFRN